MCGIAGVVRRGAEERVDPAALLRMARALRHRGPDGYGVAVGNGVGLVSTRLAIVDLAHGWQPMQLRPGGSVLVYNGEVYNHPELRADLARRGVRCRTSSDTEVVLQLLEHDGLAALDRLNGQFALAWWQPDRHRLTLLRDRFGVRPLHYALDPAGGIAFASEASALFASGEVEAAPDLLGLDDVFTTWGARAPRSTFLGVRRLGPGGVLVWERGRVVEERTWWEPDLAPAADAPEAGDLAGLLRDSVRIRLRADVPVGTYLSGGLDSSLLTALAVEASDHRLRTFSVAFDDPRYDESCHQLAVAAALGTEHHVVQVGKRDIAEAFREVVQHCETPLVRTAPVPMALLAKSVRQHGITVVATGEGADELFWGYDLFKEVALRRAALEDPEAIGGLDELYPHLTDRARGPAWRRFFTDAGPPNDPLFSHQTRAAATGVVRSLYRPDVLEHLDHRDSMSRLRQSLPSSFSSLGPLERAQWLELSTLLDPYLLAAQGDRVAMAHGVEGRYPFLDHRLLAHAAALPAARKLAGLRDKVALRELADGVLPVGIAARPKQPYRAPEISPFFGEGAPAWVDELLSEQAIRAGGLFDEQRVGGLVRRCRSGRATGQREGMALVGVLSTQVWFEHFCAPGRRTHPEETAAAMVWIDLEVHEEEGVVVA